MKYILLGLGLAFSSTFAIAGPLIDVDGGIYAWQGELSGIVGTQQALLDNRERTRVAIENGTALPDGLPDFTLRGFEEETNLNVWLSFEHPFRFYPNVRLAVFNLDYSGRSIEQIVFDTIGFRTDPITNELTLINNPTDADRADPNVRIFDASEIITTQLQLLIGDITFYYELPTPLVDIDLGLTVRMLDGDFIEQIPQVVFPFGFGNRGRVTQTTDFQIVLPTLYSKFKFNIPGTRFYSETTTNIISFNGDTMYDFDVELGYKLATIAGIKSKISVGYRFALLEVENLDTIVSDADVSGVHAGIAISF